jgi:GntR family transcriptional regulator
MSENDRHNPSVDIVAPKYYQIAQAISAGIKKGRYKVGGMLPTEANLAQMFGTSRFTVREALRIIAEQGLVERKRGSGTRVVAPMALDTFVYRLSSPAEILTYPTETHRENLFRGSIQADPDLANKINCPIGKVWFRISGIRRAGKSATPISWSDIYVLPELAEVLDAAEDGRTPVFEQIEAATGIAIVDAEIRIFASSIDGRLASLLQVAEGTPALSIMRRYLDRDGRNFETTITVHPERRFEYSLQLHREVQTI